MKKFVIVLIVLCLACPAYSASKSVNSQIKIQRTQQADMNKKIQEYNAIAKKKSQQSKNLLSQLTRLKKDANASQAQMANLEQENSRLEVSVGEINKNIDRVNASIEELLSVLKARLTGIYKQSGQEMSLSLVMNSGSTHEVVNTMYILRRFAREDQAMLEKLSQKENELSQARAALKENQDRIAAQKVELKRQQDDYNTTIKKTDKLLKTVQTEQKKAESAVKELEAAQRAVGAKINSLMKQKNAQAQKKTASAPAKTTKTVTTASTTKTSPAPATGSVSSLAWPLRGTITMQYGSRVHPTFKTKIFNSGIDIKAASGTPVKAAAPGEVLYQGWLRGFGQVVIIDHGGDLSTVYAHLSGASVREGARVSTGTVIGRVGNSGTDSEYGLHFEVRKNGAAQNPMNYLRG